MYISQDSHSVSNCMLMQNLASGFADFKFFFSINIP